MLIHLYIFHGWFYASLARSSVVATETVWPVKPKIFMTWPFGEKVYRPLC